MKNWPVTAGICCLLFISSVSHGSDTFKGLPEARQQVTEQWISEHLQASTLSPEEQTEELAWFVRAAEPLEGLEISVLSEDLATHRYESDVLARAFSEITGIKVTHDLKPEGEVIRQVNLQRIMAAKGLYSPNPGAR